MNNHLYHDMNVFVSSQRIDEPHTAALIDKLREAGFRVSHSPKNPSDGHDERWTNWYHKGLINDLDETIVFIAAIDMGWDSATWMAIESDEARRRLTGGQIRQMYYYNPLHIAVKAKGMLPYLKEQLPDDLDSVIETLSKLSQ